MDNFIVEIDVDGVLANMDGAYRQYVKHLIPDFSEEVHITDWGMPAVKKNFPEAHKIIESLYIDPMFIRNLQRYDDIEKWLNSIYKLVNKLGGKIIVHTHIFEKLCAVERDLWLKELRRDSGVDFEIDISLGKEKKKSNGSFIIIEDNIKNLQKSNAPHKILMSRAHNRKYNIYNVGEYVSAVKVENLEEVYYRLKYILNNYKIKQ